MTAGFKSESPAGFVGIRMVKVTIPPFDEGKTLASR